MAGWLELSQDLLRLITHCLLHILVKSSSHVYGGQYCQLFLVLREFSHGCCFLVTIVQMKNFLLAYMKKTAVHYLEVPVVLGKKEFRGSSHGWLVASNGGNITWPTNWR